MLSVEDKTYAVPKCAPNTIIGTKKVQRKCLYYNKKLTPRTNATAMGHTYAHAKTRSVGNSAYP